MEEREKFRPGEADSAQKTDDEDVEAHRRHAGQAEEAPTEDAGDDDVELHRKKTI